MTVLKYIKPLYNYYLPQQPVSFVSKGGCFREVALYIDGQTALIRLHELIGE